MSKGAVAVLIVLVVLVVGGVFGMKFSQRATWDKEAKADALSLIQGLPRTHEAVKEAYEPHAEYLREAVGRHHAEAFRRTYHSGGPFGAADFDSSEYEQVLWRLIAEDARANGRPEVGPDVLRFVGYLGR